MPRRQDHPGPHGDRLTCRRHPLHSRWGGLSLAAARLATVQAACSSSLGCVPS